MTAGSSSSVSVSVSLSSSCCLWNQGFVGLQGCWCGVGWSLGCTCWLVCCCRLVVGGLCSSWSLFGSVRYSLLMILESVLDRGCRTRCNVTFSFCFEVTKYMSRTLCLGCAAMVVTVSPGLMSGLLGMGFVCLVSSCCFLNLLSSIAMLSPVSVLRAVWIS